jgi:hypothetical protein
MIPKVLLITGDFNFHVDCPSEADAKKFADLRLYSKSSLTLNEWRFNLSFS